MAQPQTRTVPPRSPPRRRRAALALAAGAALTPAALGATGIPAAKPGAPPAAPAEAASSTSAALAGTLDVPAGDWEFKVAMDGAWEASFGSGADAANVPLYLPEPMTLTFTVDPDTGASGLTSPGVAKSYTGAAQAEDAELMLPPARAATGGKIFYFVMADRFANGDRANDTGGLTGDRLATGFDPTDKGFYHGGDLRGAIDQLDYIESLGTAAIWLPPSFTNMPVQGSGADGSAGYHGHWATDFTQLDPHLGGNAAMRALTNAARARHRRRHGHPRQPRRGRHRQHGGRVLLHGVGRLAVDRRWPMGCRGTKTTVWTAPATARTSPSPPRRTSP